MFKREIITVSIVVFAVLMIILLITWIIRHNNAIDEKHRKEFFNGVIKKITFDDKKMPTVYLSDTCYFLGSYSYDGLDEIMKVNDSIVKLSNTFEYILYRKDSKGVWQLIYGDPYK